MWATSVLVHTPPPSQDTQPLTLNPDLSLQYLPNLFIRNRSFFFICSVTERLVIVNPSENDPLTLPSQSSHFDVMDQANYCQRRPPNEPARARERERLRQRDEGEGEKNEFILPNICCLAMVTDLTIWKWRHYFRIWQVRWEGFNFCLQNHWGDVG